MKDNFQNKNLKEKYDKKSYELRNKLKNIKTLDEAIAITKEIKKLDIIKEEFIDSLNFNEPDNKLINKNLIIRSEDSSSDLDFNLLSRVHYDDNKKSFILFKNKYALTKIKVYIEHEVEDSKFWKKIYDSREDWNFNLYVGANNNIPQWDKKTPLKIVIYNKTDSSMKDRIYYNNEKFKKTPDKEYMNYLESIDYTDNIFNLEFKNSIEKEIKLISQGNIIYEVTTGNESIYILRNSLSNWNKNFNLNFKIKYSDGTTDNFKYSPNLVFYKEGDEKAGEAEKEADRQQQEKNEANIQAQIQDQKIQQATERAEKLEELKEEARNQVAQELGKLRQDLVNQQQELTRQQDLTEQELAKQQELVKQQKLASQELEKLRQDLVNQQQELPKQELAKDKESSIKISGNSIVNIEESNVTFTEENDVTIANQMIEDSQSKINKLIDQIKNTTNNIIFGNIADEIKFVNHVIETEIKQSRDSEAKEEYKFMIRGPPDSILFNTFGLETNHQFELSLQDLVNNKNYKINNANLYFESDLVITLQQYKDEKKELLNNLTNINLEGNIDQVGTITKTKKFKGTININDAKIGYIFESYGSLEEEIKQSRDSEAKDKQKEEEDEDTQKGTDTQQKEEEAEDKQKGTDTSQKEEEAEDKQKGTDTSQKEEEVEDKQKGTDMQQKEEEAEDKQKGTDTSLSLDCLVDSIEYLDRSFKIKTNYNNTNLKIRRLKPPYYQDFIDPDVATDPPYLFRTSTSFVERNNTFGFDKMIFDYVMSSEFYRREPGPYNKEFPLTLEFSYGERTEKWFYDPLSPEFIKKEIEVELCNIDSNKNYDYKFVFKGHPDFHFFSDRDIGTNEVEVSLEIIKKGEPETRKKVYFSNSTYIKSEILIYKNEPFLSERFTLEDYKNGRGLTSINNLSFLSKGMGFLKKKKPDNNFIFPIFGDNNDIIFGDNNGINKNTDFFEGHQYSTVRQTNVNFNSSLNVFNLSTNNGSVNLNFNPLLVDAGEEDTGDDAVEEDADDVGDENNNTDPDLASGYTLTVSEHETDLVEGQTTYRVYVDMVNAEDFLSSVYGNQEEPLSFATDEGFYNSPIATGATANGINPAFFPFPGFESLPADSWLTIGIESKPVGDEISISTVEDSSQPYLDRFVAGSANSGQDFVINTIVGGAWYVLNGTPNGLPDENGQVLVMQFTTGGSFNGRFNIQIFENGNGENDIRQTFIFDDVGTFSSITDKD